MNNIKPTKSPSEKKKYSNKSSKVKRKKLSSEIIQKKKEEHLTTYPEVLHGEKKTLAFVGEEWREMNFISKFWVFKNKGQAYTYRGSTPRQKSLRRFRDILHLNDG